MRVGANSRHAQPDAVPSLHAIWVVPQRGLPQATGTPTPLSVHVQFAAHALQCASGCSAHTYSLLDVAWYMLQQLVGVPQMG